MAPRDIYDSKHWRDRAAEMRVLAEGMKDRETRRVMNHLADDYDKLADRAQARAERDKQLNAMQPRGPARRL